MKQYFHFRLFTLAATWLLLTCPAVAQPGPAFYSNVGQAQPGVTCFNAGAAICYGAVERPGRAADTDLTNYATLRPSVVAAGLFPVSLRLGMSGTVPANYRAGVVIGSNTGLSAIGSVTVRTYLKTGDAVEPRETLVLTTAARTVLGTAQPGRLEFVTKQPFNQLEVEAAAVLNLAYEFNVYYAYGIDANVVQTALGVVSRFEAPVAGGNYSTAVVDNGVTVCASSNVLNPERAADQSLTNYATFTTLAGVSCPSTLRVKLEAAAPGGYYAGFVVGQQGTLDLNALSNLRVTTFLNGEPRETAIGPELLRVMVLPDGQQQISFATTQAFDEVQLTRGAAGSALDNLNVYYGFGLEPRVFQDQTPVLSNFSSGANQFQVSTNGVLCVACNTSNTNVLNPERAADANLSPNDYAEIRTGLASALTSTALRLNLNGTGVACNAAGVVLSQGTGLLSTELLSGLTIRTYGGPDGNQLIESASGASLLSQSLLADGRSEVYFLTTQNFQRVEIEVSSAVSALDRTRVYYAFAEDRPTGFPRTIALPAPLPVELVAFAATAAGPAVDVTWRTASERDNSYFVVERAIQGKEGFSALGRVEGSGTSGGRAYGFRDATAAATQAATLFYRLRQVDRDGTQHYSPVVAVAYASAKASMFDVYPNPASGSADVKVELASFGAGEGATGVLKIYDMRGILLRELPAGQRVVNLLGEALPAGLYNVVLLGSQGQQLGSKRLVLTGR